MPEGKEERINWLKSEAFLENRLTLELLCGVKIPTITLGVGSSVLSFSPEVKALRG